VADFVKLAATAKRLVEKNARTVRLVKLNRTPSSSSEPWRGSDAAPATGTGGATLPAKACFVPASGSGLGKLVFDLTGRLETAFEQIGLVASNSVGGADLSGFDQVVDDNSVWKIEARGELRPASKSLLWVLGLKR